jgi:orotidine-5'-phosphate decarboxylase
MNRTELIEQIKKKESFLCIGLDTDLEKIPKHLLGCADPIFEFNKQIIDATHSFCVAYKPNTAFYEAHGLKGWASLEKTAAYLRSNYPNHFSSYGCALYGFRQCEPFSDLFWQMGDPASADIQCRGF